jgi:hypothetical protein
MTNFAEQLAAAVEDYPDRPAVKLDELVFSYGSLDAYGPANASPDEVRDFVRQREIEVPGAIPSQARSEFRTASARSTAGGRGIYLTPHVRAL